MKEQTRVLVTGCAGFIGSVVTEYLVANGFDVYGVDNFQSSYPEAVNKNIKFWRNSIGNNLDALFKWARPDVVCHLAAESVIGKASSDPYIFFRDNVIYGINLLEAMRYFGCNKLVMSSTGSSYGEPEYTPIDEEHPQNPINAYGESKYIFERILKWYAKSYGLQYIMFRYFNVGGATLENGERRKNETRLIPVALDCAYHNKPLYLFGTDYPTKDGTPIRDYLHVADVAKSHIYAIEDLLVGDSPNINDVFNLGSEEGFTVLEIVKMVEEFSGKKIEIVPTERRPGDPVKLVASCHKAKKSLLWIPNYSNLETIVKDSIRWYESRLS